MAPSLQRLLLFLALRSPGEIVIGAIGIGLLGAVIGTGTTLLIRRRSEAPVLTRTGLLLSLLFVVFCLGDGGLLWALPHLRLSFAPDARVPLGVSLLVRLLLFWGLLGAVLLAYWRTQPKKEGRVIRSAIFLLLIINLGFSAAQIDAYVVEPLWVETTEQKLRFADLDPAAPPIRVVHLTDAHIARNSYREEKVIRLVNKLQPDIILLTGDYLNLSYLSDPTSVAHFRRFVAQLEAPYGIYAVRGSVEPTLESMERLVEGTEVVWLEQETTTVDVRGQQVTLVGVACSHQHSLDTARLAQTMEGVPEEAFTILMYHSPDLIAEAVEHRVDLYLGGHTHGGQIRLPFYGAVVTASKYGRRYAAGLFEEGDTTMIISRGLGFEGGAMPRARFLCRPEIVCIDLEGQ